MRRKPRGRINTNFIQFRGGLKYPMPDRFQTKATTYGKLVLTNPFMSSHGAILGNTLFTPWDNAESGFFSGITPNYATLDPVGINALLNGNLYQSYRVFASSINIRVANQDVNHQLEIAVIPSTVNVSGVTMNTLVPQPGCKLMTCTNSKTNILKHYCTSHKVFGITARAIKDDVSGQMDGSLSSGPSATWLWWVFAQTTDQQNSAANLILDISVTYYFECWNLQKGILTN